MPLPKKVQFAWEDGVKKLKKAMPSHRGIWVYFIFLRAHHATGMFAID